MSVYSQNIQNKDYILVLNSVSFDAGWSEELYLDIKDTFEKQNFLVEAEELKIPMLETMKDAQEKRAYLQNKYTSLPRVVVFIGDPGWLVCRELFDSIWKDIPIIICHSKDLIPARIEDLLLKNISLERNMVPAKELYEKYNLTVIQQPFFVKETVKLMYQLIPDMNKVAFISDNRYISAYARFEVQEAMKKYFPELDLDLITTPDVSTEKLLDSLSMYDRKVGIIYYSWFIPQNSGKNSYLNDNIQRIIYGFSSSPVFTLSDLNAKSGNFAGGCYISNETLSETIIEKIHRILLGGEARDIPWDREGVPTVYLNYHHLEHHGISPHLYPSKAIYYQSPPGFYEKYKIYLISSLVVLFLIIVIVIMRIFIFVQKQKQKEQKIKLLTEYRRMVDNMPLIYARKELLLNKDGEVYDFIFRDVNTAFEKIFICYKSQILGKRFSELCSLYNRLNYIRKDEVDKKGAVILPDDTNQNQYFDKLVFATDNKNVVDVFYIDKTEAYTAWLKTEEGHRLLEALNEKYELLLRASRMVSWSWNLETGMIETDTEYAADNEDEKKQYFLTDEQFFSMIHPDDREKIYNAYQALISGNALVLHDEFRVLSPYEENAFSWIESYGIIGKRDAAGNPSLLVGGSLDINKRKKMEQEILEKEKVEESNRLKSAFLANMSHEIRTPLNAIVGFSALLATTDDLEEKKEFVEIIENNNTLLLQLINDILDLSKIEAGTLDFVYSMVDVNDLLNSIEQSTRMRPHAEGVEIVFEERLPECVIYTERNRLTQVLTNFLNNALKFTEKGKVVFGYKDYNDKLYFYVKDTGCGIPEDKLGQIFGRFVKLNSFEQGTGLGLSICDTIIEKMNGQIGVDSEVGIGSTFWITIPKLTTSPEEKEKYLTVEPEVVSGSQHSNKPVLLIAEDNQYNFKLFESVLKNDYILLHAWNGMEAVTLFKNHQPDLILMDIKMPGLDGYGATQRIRELSSAVPIVAVTAYAFAENERNIMQSGFSDYVSKPINAIVLINKIKTLLKME